MEQAKMDHMSARYNKVGAEIILAGLSASPDLWLYATAGEGWVGPALFAIGEGELLWVDDLLIDLGMSVLDLWMSEEPAKRWEVMEFELHGTEFKSRFHYPGDLPPDDELGFARRDELIRRRFGNFKVVYPPDPSS